MAKTFKHPVPYHKEEPLRVLITAAGTKLSQALAMLVAAGEAFGQKQPVFLHLIDVPAKARFMEGLQMELCDMAYPLLADVLTSSDPVEAFKDVSAAFLVGDHQITDIVTRSEVLEMNVRKFKDYGLCLAAMARPNCKILIVTEPANTLAYVCCINALSMPRENFTALSRLIYNRAIGVVSNIFNVDAHGIKNLLIWGNDSETAYPDLSRAKLIKETEVRKSADQNNEEANLRHDVIEKTVKRGAQIRALRKVPSALGVAKAACDQMGEWWLGTKPGEVTSMGVYSDGAYSSAKDVFFSLPVQVTRGRYIIYKNYKLDEFCKTRIEVASKELLMEKAEALTELQKDF